VTCNGPPPRKGPPGSGFWGRPGDKAAQLLHRNLDIVPAFGALYRIVFQFLLVGLLHSILYEFAAQVGAPPATLAPDLHDHTSSSMVLFSAATLRLLLDKRCKPE
jgi:hypothetical protein